MANKTNTKKEETNEAMMTENEALEEEFEEEVEVKKKKGFHPIQAIKEFKKDFEKNHPVAAKRIEKGCDIAKGVGLGAVATVTVLAAIGKSQDGSDGNETLALPDLGDNSKDSDDNPPAGLE